MKKIILQKNEQIHPFNEPARDLRCQNKPLWLVQRDVLAEHTTQEISIAHGSPLPEVDGPCIAYSDNLYFDGFYIAEFLQQARNIDKPVRAAFKANDPAFREHALPLSNSYTRDGDVYLAELWYYPDGPTPDADPLVIDLQAREIGYYHIPTYMASSQGDLTFQVPLRSLIAVDSWVHLFVIDVVYGLFSRGARYENRLDSDPWFKLANLVRSMYEGRQVLESSMIVEVGKNCIIDPSATIHGPTTIGDNVTIGAGAVIENSIIGSNANISQGCQVMLSVVGDGTFLPFRASLFMSTMMENSMVAQNTCLQMCVIGRNTFIGAGSTFTDFNLLPTPLRAISGDGLLGHTNREVLGGAVGHNCRIGSGMIVFPGRTIESDVVLFASTERRVIDKDIRYEDSDHHKLQFANLHQRFHPRSGEEPAQSW
jgi:carbonic anhydrase/acetyltransferase-like protein (isoleucine patch superfamily)